MVLLLLFGGGDDGGVVVLDGVHGGHAFKLRKNADRC